MTDSLIIATLMGAAATWLTISLSHWYLFNKVTLILSKLEQRIPPELLAQYLLQYFRKKKDQEGIMLAETILKQIQIVEQRPVRSRKRKEAKND